MSIHVKLRYILKVFSAAAWVVVLSVTYAYSWDNPPGFAQTIQSWFGSNSSAPSLFFLAVVAYLSPNMLAAVLFMFPFIRRFLERSNYKIVMLLMWWSQVSRMKTKFFWSFLYDHTMHWCVCDACTHVIGLLCMCFFWFHFSMRRQLDVNDCFLLQPRLYVGRGMHESTFSLFK